MHSARAHAERITLYPRQIAPYSSMMAAESESVDKTYLHLEYRFIFFLLIICIHIYF